ncbi:10591_t:CDS:2, partial [Gigaspora margarita]
TRILCAIVKKTDLLSLKMMFETIENNKEIIKASIKLIWIATNGKVVNIIFDDPMLLAKVFLDNDTSKIIILDEPKAVLLNKNNYRKIRNELAGKSSIAIDEEEVDNNEDHEPIQESRLVEDTMKNQLSDLRLDASNITSQKTNMESNFEISERDSANNNERAEFLQIDDNINELYNRLSPSDEYSDTEEENNELIFDSLVSSPEKRNEAKNSNSNDKVTDKHVNNALDRVSSDLTNNSLPSINEVLVT